MSRLEQLPPEPAEEHFLIPLKGTKELALMLDGNGVKADQVRLVKHDTQVHVVHAQMLIEMKPDMTSSQRSGNQPAGKTMPTKEAVMADSVARAIVLANDATVQAEIGEFLDKKPGRSFGEKPFRFKLAAAHEQYSVVDKCLKCNGATTNPCKTCNASGSAPCTGCVGNGFTQCPVCYATGQQQRADGTRMPCTKCSGTGRSMCMTCQGQKFLRCAVCTGQGRTSCTECDRTGFWTHIFDAHWHVEATFELERKMTLPEVIEVVELLGVQKTATEGHAEILRLVPEIAGDKLILPYAALLPVAQVEFSIIGKTHPAVVAGLHGRIIEIEPLLDTYIKPGVSALVKLSKGPLAAAALVASACRFKMIRQVLAGLTHHSKGHVYQKLKKEYPLVVTDKFAKATIRYADLALLALAEGPRWKGLAVGAAAAGAAYAAYFMTPAREAVRGLMVSQRLEQHLLAIDVLVWVIGCGIAVIAVKIFAAKALKKILPQTVQVKEHGLPAAGRQGWIGMPVTLLLWIVFAFLSQPRPEWLSAALQKIGVSL
ncbi:MAG: zinc finger-like domain-containing protein [Alphaproteobacteria bacterium]